MSRLRARAAQGFRARLADDHQIRVGPLSATIAAHVGIIAVLLMPSAVKPRPVSSTLALFNISATAAVPAAAPPKQVQREAVLPTLPRLVIVPPPVFSLPTVNQTVVAMIEQTDALATGGACDLTEPVQAALRASDAVLTSLPEIPPERRSVANVIMIWNSDWIALHETLDPQAMTIIRDTVAATITAASLDCRLQPQSGPRLIMIPGSSDTTVLALGSGMWRWQDVLETAQVQQAAAVPVGTAEEKSALSHAARASFLQP